MTIGVFRPVPFKTLFCSLSNILGTCILLRVICLKPRQPFVAEQENTPSSPEALANTITAPTSFLFSPSSWLVTISLKSHQKNRLWSQRDGAVRGIAIRQLSLKWRHFDHKKSMWHITSWTETLTGLSEMKWLQPYKITELWWCKRKKVRWREMLGKIFIQNKIKLLAVILFYSIAKFSLTSGQRSGKPCMWLQKVATSVQLSVTPWAALRYQRYVSSQISRTS